LPAKFRMPGPQKGTQRHARIFHSYFLVFERDRTPSAATTPDALPAHKSPQHLEPAA
jgi:hypothetical protein